MRFRASGCLLPVVAVAALVATYWPVREFGFLEIDTRTYVLHPRVAAAPTLENLWWLLTNRIAANWTPLSWYSHTLDHLWFGDDAGAHHLSNVAYHALAAFAVFAALHALTAEVAKSAVVALLFAFHPLRVESVAWIVERKDLLSGLFGALTLWAYASYARRPRPLTYALAWLAFVLSLLAKSMLVTLPCLLWVLDYWPLRRFSFSAPAGRAVSTQRLVLEKLPFFVPALLTVAMTRAAAEGSLGSDAALQADQRWLNAIHSVAQYVRKTFAPTDLSLWYAHPYLPSTGGQGLRASEIGAAVGLIALMTVFGVMNFRKRPYLLAGWLWFAGTLVPTLGLVVQAGRQGMADRFTYFPSIGLFIAIVWAAAEWLRHGVLRESARRAAAFALATACLLCLGVRSRAEMWRWRDAETIYLDALAKNPRNTQVHYALGDILVQRGELDRALAHFTAAAELTPQWDDLVTGLANRLRDAGRHREALQWYRRAYAASPSYNHTRINLAAALAAAGRFDEAAPLLRDALRHNPRSVGSHVNLAIIEAQAGRLREARRLLDRALELDSRSVAALRASSRVLALAGERDAAIERAARWLQIDPANDEARETLARLRAEGVP